MIKMQKHKAEDSDDSSVMSAGEERNTALSSYFEPDVNEETFGNIKFQTLEKSKAYTAFNHLWEWIQYNKRKMRRDGYYKTEAAIGSSTHPIPKQQRDVLGSEAISFDQVETEDDAVKCLKQILSNLMHKKLIAETIRYKHQRRKRYTDVLDAKELTKELLTVNAPYVS